MLLIQGIIVIRETRELICGSVKLYCIHKGKFTFGRRGGVTMKIKLFEGQIKKTESAVNDFIAQDDIKVIEVKLASSINGIAIMVVYEQIKSAV